MQTSLGLRCAGWSALGLTSAFLAVFLLLPLGIALYAGLSPNLLYEAVAHPLYQQGLLNSAAVALVTTLLAFVIAVPLAWIGSRYRFRGQGIAEALLLSPLILPPFVGALGVYQILGQYGVLNALLAHLGLIVPGAGPDWLGRHRFAAVCVVEALGLFPILYLNTVANLRRLDHSLLEAAQNLGASKWLRLRRIVLPLLRPGLFAGGIIVFVWSFTELGTPLMLGYERVTPVQIFSGLNEVNSNHLPFALVVIMLAVATTLYLVARLVFMRRFDAVAGKGGIQAPPVQLRGWRAAAAWAPFALVIALAVTPHSAVVLLAFARDWYQTVLPAHLTLDHAREALSHPQVVPSIINSLKYAGCATALALVVGTFIAWIGTRWRPRGWQVLDAVAMLPLAIPGVILAFGYLAMATSVPGLREWLNPLRDPTLILIIAYTVRRLPHVLRSAAAGLAQAPVVYEEAAASLGAGLATRLRRITLPLIAGSLMAGALLTFSSSMLEVSDSLVLAQKRDFFPITRVIYDLVSILGSGPSVACAFAAWAMLFLASALGAAAALLGKNVSGLFKQ